MAYVADPYRDEEERAAAQGQPAAPQALSMGRGTAPAPAGASLASPGQPATPAPQQGRFADFQRVFRANQGGATEAANQLAQGVEKQGTDAEAARTGLVDRFNTGLNAGTPAGARPQASFGAAAGPQLSPEQVLAQRAAPKAASVGAPTLAREVAATQAGARYAGPDSIADDKEFAGTVAQTRAAENRANAIGTSAGRQALVGELGGTRGQNRLDAALLGQAGGERFRGLRERFGGLTGKLGEAGASSQVAAGDARTAVARYAGQGRGALERYGKLDAAPAGSAEGTGPLRGGTTIADRFIADHPGERDKGQFTVPKGTSDQAGKLYDGNVYGAMVQHEPALGARFQSAFADDPAAGAAVWASMTMEEASAVVNMGTQQAIEWLQGRYRDLGGAANASKRTEHGEGLAGTPQK